MIKVFTRDGRYFKFDKYDANKQMGYVLDKEGKMDSAIYFYNDSIIAIEYTKGERLLE